MKINQQRMSFRLLEASVIGFWLIIALVLSLCIIKEKLFYLLGFGILGVLLLTVWIKERYDVGLIVILVATTFIEFGSFRGWMLVTFLGTRLYIGLGTLVFLIVIGIYVIKQIPIHKGIFRNPLKRRLAAADTLLILYAFSWLAASILRVDRFPITARFFYPPNDWILYALRPALFFFFVPRLLSTQRLVSRFSSLVFLLGAFLSLLDTFRLLTGQAVMPVALTNASALGEAAWQSKVEITTPHIESILGPSSFGGAFFLAFLPIGFSLFMLQRRILFKLIYLGACVSMITNIVFYQDRGSWCGLFVSILFYVYLVSKRQRANTIGIVILTILGAVTFNWITWSGGTLSPTEYVHILVSSDRWILWANTLSAIPHIPLTGIGSYSTYAFTAALLSYGIYGYGGRLAYVGGEYWQPHNSYLQLLIAEGHFTFLFFMAFLGCVFWRSLKTIKTCNNTDADQLLLIGFLAGVVGFCTEAFFDRTLFEPLLVTYFWVFLGTINSLNETRNDRLRNT